MPRYRQSTLAAMEEARRISRDSSVASYDSMDELKKALDEWWNKTGHLHLWRKQAAGFIFYRIKKYYEYGREKHINSEVRK